MHHVAFRIPDADYDAWADRLKAARVPTSGPVDRYYFRSLYFREPNGILFEIATDGPGFTADEPLESLGEGLALPPFLEPRRAEIEAGLKPLRPDRRFARNIRTIPGRFTSSAGVMSARLDGRAATAKEAPHVCSSSGSGRIVSPEDPSPPGRGGGDPPNHAPREGRGREPSVRGFED